MRQLALLVALCASASAASAQEIGKEIPPPPPPTSGSTPAEFGNPYAPPPAPPAASAPVAAPVAAGPSAKHAGSFGLKIGFSGSVPVRATATSGDVFANSTSSNVGLRWIPAERIALDLDLGFAMVLSDPPRAAFTVGTELDIYLGSLTGMLRPLFAVGVAFLKPLSGSDDDFALDARLGFGAEHWFTDNFSVFGKAMVNFIAVLDGNTPVRLGTLTPSLGTTFYF